MKKLLAILLTALLLLPLGLALRTADASSETEDDIWAQITAYEDTRLREKGLRSASATELDYAEMADGVKDIVKNWNGYVPGSLVQNGSHLIWDGKDGTGYGYSPRLRQKLRSEALTGADPDAESGVETVSYAVRGGSSGSNDVALFGPYYGLDSSFTNQYQTEANSIAQTLGGTYTLYKTTAATIDNIANALETCGVVFFDSHGDTDYASGDDYTSRANTSYICLQSGDGFTAADQASVQGTYGSYKHAYYAGAGYSGMKYYCADGTAIRNHMDKTAPNNLLWMAICLGMATSGMEAPLHAQGVEVVYGYSQSVTFAGDYKWEDYFWDEMKDGSMVKDAIAYMKQKVGIKDPYTSVYPAYPIVVSSEDTYPGQGHVDAAQTVKSTWTLFKQYDVTAQSNNTSWGTVSVSGYTVTAKPKTGYFTESAVVSPASAATLTRDGDVFTLLNVSADCSVTVNFAPKTAVSVSFDANGGTGSMQSVTVYSGDPYTLPDCSFAPPADLQFAGWKMQGDETVYLPGDKLVITGNTVFCAQWATSSVYTRVTWTPGDWSGQYLIVYQTGSTYYALDGSLDKPDVVKNYRSGVISGNQIIVPCMYDNFYFTIEKKDDHYTARSKSGLYIGMPLNSNGLSANDGIEYKLKITQKGSETDIESSGGAHLRFNKAADQMRFRFYKSSTYTAQQSIVLYKLMGDEPVPTPTPTPSTKPSASPSASPTASPSASPSASPAVDPNATVEWNAEDVSFKGTTPYVICDGTAKTPRFTVKAEDGTVIDPADYDYEYRENVNAGTAYVIVTFKNAFTGTAQGWFKIYLPATNYTKVENRSDGIYIEWNAVEGAAGYVIYRRAWSTTTNGWTNFERWNNTPDLFWTDTQTYAGTRYQYGVKAYFEQRVDPVSGATIGGNVGDNYNLGEVGPLKTTVRITTRVLNSVTGGTKQITAAWSASKNFTGYEVQIATDEAFTKNVQSVTITDYMTAEHTFKNLKAKTTYFVRVRSYHEFEGFTYYGQWSNVMSAKTK